MCARYTLAVGDTEIAVGDSTVSVRSRRRFNIAPSQGAPVIWLLNDHLVAAEFRWGFVPPWMMSRPDARSMINARGESAATKPMFRGAFKSRRCLAPADGFYEWGAENGKRVPWRFSRPDGRPFLMAAIWEPLDAEGTPGGYALLTTSANATVAPLHDRMPVILDASAAKQWVTGSVESASALIQPCPVDWLGRRRIDPALNGAKDDRSELMAPPAAEPPRLVTGELFPL
jgi:putative SOS response-associated peptidase YedK